MPKFNHSLNQHWTCKHGTMKPKKQFKTLEDSLDYISRKGINSKVYNPYVCTECGQWHIGHFHHLKHRK